MRRMRPLHLVGLAAFLAWEAFWAYCYLTATTPDYSMARPAAILFAVVAPGIILGIALALLLVLRAFLRLPPR